MTHRTESVGYAAMAVCREVTDGVGNVKTEEGTVVWLGLDPFSSTPVCWPGLESARHAHMFESPEEARRRWRSWHLSTWWYSLREGSLRVYRVTRVSETTVQEVLE